MDSGNHQVIVQQEVTIKQCHRANETIQCKIFNVFYCVRDC